MPNGFAFARPQRRRASDGRPSSPALQGFAESRAVAMIFVRLHFRWFLRAVESQGFDVHPEQRHFTLFMD